MKRIYTYITMICIAASVMTADAQDAVVLRNAQEALGSNASNKTATQQSTQQRTQYRTQQRNTVQRNTQQSRTTQQRNVPQRATRRTQQPTQTKSQQQTTQPAVQQQTTPQTVTRQQTVQPTTVQQQATPQTVTRQQTVQPTAVQQQATQQPVQQQAMPQTVAKQQPVVQQQQQQQPVTVQPTQQQQYQQQPYQTAQPVVPQTVSKQPVAQQQQPQQQAVAQYPVQYNEYARYNNVAREPVEIMCNDLRQRGGSLFIDLLIYVQSDYVKSKKSLTLTPVLETDAQLMSFPSMLFNGKNRHKVYEREIQLGNLIDEPRYAVIRAFDAPEHAVAYQMEIPWEEWMKDAEFNMYEDLCGCGKEEGAVYDVTDRVLRMPDERYQPRPALAYITPMAETRKEREEVGTAYLDFVVNRYEIKHDFRNNAIELEKINKTIRTVLNDKDVTADNISLKGFASPEGTYKNNTFLAQNRTKALRDYIMSMYGFKADFFQLDFEPEDWEGFKTKVEADPMTPSRYEVLSIIDSQMDPDTKERRLRELSGGVPYRYVLSEMFPSLRRTEYVINYTVRGFSLEEGREIIKTRPKLLSLNEMFAVANSYQVGSDEYNEVFDIAVRIYSSDPVANLNAANIALSKNDVGLARHYLASAGNSAEAVHARGILNLLDGNYDEAVRLLEEAKAAGVKEAAINLEELRKKVEDDELFDSFGE